MTMVIKKTGLWRTRRPIIDKEKCTKCGICWMYCPDNAVLKNHDDYYEINYEICKGCGICVEECPAEAITEVKETFEE